MQTSSTDADAQPKKSDSDQREPRSSDRAAAPDSGREGSNPPREPKRPDRGPAPDSGAERAVSREGLAEKLSGGMGLDNPAPLDAGADLGSLARAAYRRQSPDAPEEVPDDAQKDAPDAAGADAPDDASNDGSADAPDGVEARAEADAPEEDADPRASGDADAKRDGADQEQERSPIQEFLASLRLQRERNRSKPAARLQVADNVGRKPPPGRGLVGGGPVRERRAPAAPKKSPGRGGPAPRL